MILVARKVVEQIAEHQKLVSASSDVMAGKTLPGYRSYEAALEAQVVLSEMEHKGSEAVVPDES